MTMRGELIVLNTGAGELRFSFDKDDPVETERARRTVEDMLQRGYVLMVNMTRRGKTTTIRAKGFDAKTDEYIIATDALYAGDPATGADAVAPAKTGQRKRGSRVKAKNVNAIAIGRSAGG